MKEFLAYKIIAKKLLHLVFHLGSLTWVLCGSKHVYCGDACPARATGPAFSKDLQKN